MAKIVKLIPDLILIAGACTLSYGAWLIYSPSGFIVGGILAIIYGVLATKASSVE